MKTNIVIYISPPISYLAEFSSYRPKCCWPIKFQDSFKCNSTLSIQKSIRWKIEDGLNKTWITSNSCIFLT